MQIRQRKTPMGGEQTVGKEECARSALEQPHSQLSGPFDPFVREIGIEEIGKVRRQHA